MALSQIGHNIFLSRLNVITQNSDGFSRIAPLHRLQ